MTLILLLFEISVELDDPAFFSIEELLFVDDGRLVTTHGISQRWTRPTWIDGATLPIEEQARILCHDNLGRAALGVRLGTRSPQGPEHVAACLTTLAVSAQHPEDGLAWVAQETDEDEPPPGLWDIEVVAMYDLCCA